MTCDPAQPMAGGGPTGAPLVFISYAQGSDDHQEQVRQLWHFLRANGVNATLDLPAADRRQDWAIWMLHQVRAARFVLIIASPEYRRRSDGEAAPDEGRGVQWEAALIREEVYANGRAALQKFVPVILPGRSVADVPSWLGPTTTSHYSIDAFTVVGAGGLLRLLTGQPEEPQPPLGRAPPLPPRAAKDSGPYPADESLDVAPIRRLFLHFFDPHFMDEVTRGRNSEFITAEADRATRLAMLAARTVFVPAASYIESSLCADIVNQYRRLFDTGQIVLIGGEANLVDFATAKLLQYEPGSDRFSRYEAVLSSSSTTPPFRSRGRSATQDISIAWLRQLDNLSELLKGLPPDQFANLEPRWADLPTWLGRRAFTPEHAVHGLFDSVPTGGPELIVARRAGSRINASYFQSYTTELGAGLVTDLAYLHSSHTGDRGSVDLPYRRLLSQLGARNLLESVLDARPERLAGIRHHPDVAAALVASLTALAIGKFTPGPPESLPNLMA